MNVLEELMNERWISKYRDRDRYYRIKDELGTVRDFLVEKLGYRIISNSSLVKLEKLPGEALPWMGVQEFKNPSDYALFCVILMFLEDKEAEEQFVLSQLTEYITASFPEGQMAWTVYTNRQRLIRVMKYCMKNDLLLIDDGNGDNFVTDMEAEALYENTGLSKYFVRTFTKNINSYQTVADFFQSEWLDMNEERGVIRRQRVYRKLLLSLGMYREKEQDEDFNYVKNYRSIIENDLEQFLDVSLQIYKSSAYLILGENGDLGRTFPARNSLSDAILLFHAEVRNRVESGELKPEINERILVPLLKLREMIRETRQKYGSGLTKAYREMSGREFEDCLIEELKSLDFLRIDAVTEEVQIMPVAGKIMGTYPERYLEQKREEGDTDADQ
ncbi:TIGR02678 family protein [Clostridium sp. Marseille-P2415]|uniref:TIGR02678 family protein n=1 Tax=Clostridium sp. Marseille-P2415 TaxID=1805471 RepID=UPI0009883B29|nr:TIGR02678 family protein [Clostridium sp. Marseille-P2415]